MIGSIYVGFLVRIKHVYQWYHTSTQMTVTDLASGYYQGLYLVPIHTAVAIQAYYVYDVAIALSVPLQHTVVKYVFNSSTILVGVTFDLNLDAMCTQLNGCQ